MRVNKFDAWGNDFLVLDLGDVRSQGDSTGPTLRDPQSIDFHRVSEGEARVVAEDRWCVDRHASENSGNATVPMSPRRGLR